jgi:hypothetical protein
MLAWKLMRSTALYSLNNSVAFFFPQISPVDLLAENLPVNHGRLYSLHPRFIFMLAPDEVLVTGIQYVKQRTQFCRSKTIFALRRINLLGYVSLSRESTHVSPRNFEPRSVVIAKTKVCYLSCPATEFLLTN